jgi:hypothetical protein
MSPHSVSHIPAGEGMQLSTIVTFTKPLSPHPLPAVPSALEVAVNVGGRLPS